MTSSDMHPSKDEHLQDLVKKQTKQEIDAIGAEVELAKATSDLEVQGALDALETLELEDQDKFHGDPKKLQEYKERSMKSMQENVYGVEAARADASVIISESVKSVEDARKSSYVKSPNFVADPTSPKDPIFAQEASKVKIARATADVKIAQLDARGKAAWITAKVEMNKRVYGEKSPEYMAAKEEAKGRMGMLVGDIEMVKSKALGDISKAVAKVEITQANLGIVSQEVSKGQRNYLKYFKKPCGFDGAKFAQKHTQEEWDRLRRSGKLAKEATKICPNLSFKEEWTLPLYAFCYMYAKESGNIPSCPDH